jgi:hypothetical protein
MVRHGIANALWVGLGLDLSPAHVDLGGHADEEGVVEAIWAVIALRRYVQSTPDAHQRSAETTGAPDFKPEPDRERALQRR